MALIIDESFEYRHKKFNQGKRPREDSNTSHSSEDYEVDIESLDERPYTQKSSESTSAISYNFKELQTSSTSSPAPLFKRRRTSYFSNSTHSAFTFRNTSTPLGPPTTSSPALAPSAAILPKISDETLRNICKYHDNMVRQFPKKQRTPKDQERRDKNTIACRMSRRVKKLEHIAIEEQYKEFSQQTFEIIEQAMRSTAYLHELMKLSNERIGDWGEEMETKLFELKEEEVSPEKKPFSIAFLMGAEE